MQDFAQKFSRTLQKGSVISLWGDLGTGKTTFAQGFIGAFGVKKVKSPTFSIYNIYDVKKRGILKIYHFDLYRISDVHELVDLGFEEILANESAHVLIEWPERATNLLPKSQIRIVFTDLGESRRGIGVYKK